MSRVHPAGRMLNPGGVGVIAFVANPGCAACASTLGFVVERLRRKQRSGRTIMVARFVSLDSIFHWPIRMLVRRVLS